MSCWDFVFSSEKTQIDDLVRQADKYTKDMNEDFEHFFCCYAEDMYKTQRELSCYRALKVVLSAGSHDDVKLYMESKINSLTDSLLTGSIRKNSTSAASNLEHTMELEVHQKIREKFTILLGIIEKGETVEGQQETQRDNPEGVKRRVTVWKDTRECMVLVPGFDSPDSPQY